MQEQCVLCRIINTREDVVFETEYFLSHLDKNPETPGHTILVPKRHIVSVFDLSSDEWNDMQIALIGTVKEIAKLKKPKIYSSWIEAKPYDNSLDFWRRALAHMGVNKKPDAYNIGINEGKAAGREIDHLHVHIMPRYEGDEETPKGGVRKVIPGRGIFKDKI